MNRLRICFRHSEVLHDSNDGTKQIVTIRCAIHIRCQVARSEGFVDFLPRSLPVLFAEIYAQDYSNITLSAGQRILG